MKNYIIVGILLFGFSSCIEDLGVFTGSDPTYIVEGSVTSQSGPHRIKLSVSKEYNTAAVYSEVERASIYIVDNEGIEIELIDRFQGNYETPNTFSGEIGKSYQLQVTLSSGLYFESTFEKMLAVPDIDNARYEIVTKEVLTEANVIIDDQVVAFFIDYCDEEDEENFYRWRYLETFEVVAPAAANVGSIGLGGFGRCESAFKNPLCWANNYDREFLKIDTDLLFNGLELKNVEVFYTETGRKFASGYSVEIQQLSLSRSAYQYWEAIENQIGNNSTIFETSNYQIKGNISMPDDKEALVLGYFEASAVASQRIFIRPSEVFYTHTYQCAPNEIGCIPAVCIDCTKYSASSTNVMPEFWEL